jgi:hypothetical protein
MIVLVTFAVLMLLLLTVSLWAAGGQTVYTTPGSGIIEAIPGALEAEPMPPAGRLIILSYPLAYAWEVSNAGHSPPHWVGATRHGPSLGSAAMCHGPGAIPPAVSGPALG